MWEQVLNLPVIVQGALGSFLFWLIFEISKRVINIVITFFAKFSENTQRELNLYQSFFHLRCGFEGDTQEYATAHVISIFQAFRRFLYGLIYICLGLISSNWLGELSVIAYIIAVFNFFIALTALKSTWGTGLSLEEHKEKYHEIMDGLIDTPNEGINKNT